jgi:hypothetical protein
MMESIFVFWFFFFFFFYYSYVHTSLGSFGEHLCDKGLKLPLRNSRACRTDHPKWSRSDLVGTRLLPSVMTPATTSLEPLKIKD